mgnify:CR=1 FL=1
MDLTPPEDKVSLYRDELAGVSDLIKAIADIKSAFPTLPLGFYDKFDDRITANKFTRQRLMDAVNYVIDNCIYPTPTIAQFISFDKTVKFKSHDEMCKEAGAYPEIWNQWLPVKMPDLPRVIWVFENDIVKYKLEQYKKG